MVLENINLSQTPDEFWYRNKRVPNCYVQKYCANRHFACISVTNISCHPICEPIDYFNEGQETDAEAQAHETP